MAINFPDSPSDGQVQGGFKYNSSKGVWEGIELAQTASVGDNAPGNPDNGDLWWDSSTGQMYIYYVDGSSNQWVSISNPGEIGPGVPTVYANLAGFPSSGNSVGDFGIANDNKALYMWNGSAWTRANVGADALPEITTTPASTHTLNSDGTNTAITIVASDPEGFPITYSHDTNPSSPNQVTNIVENNGVFTLVPSTNQAHAGNFTLRLKASDGVHVSSHSIAVSLAFAPANPILFSASGTSWAQDWSSNDAYFNNSVNGISLTTYMNNSGIQAYRSNPLKVGNYYFEVDMRGNDRINSPTSGGFFPEGGLGLYGGTASTWGYNSTGLVFMGSTATGNWGYISAPSYSASDRSPGQFAAPEGRIIHFAYNSTTRKAWIGTSDDGTSIGWSTVGGVPGVGTGYNLGGSSGGAIVFAFGGTSNVTTSQFKGYFRTGNRILGTAPAGYSNLD